MFHIPAHKNLAHPPGQYAPQDEPVPEPFSEAERFLIVAWVGLSALLMGATVAIVLFAPPV